MNQDTNIKEYKNINKKSLVFKANREEHYTSYNTLRTFDNAVSYAESLNYPNRYYLLELYHDIIKDAHLSSLMKHRKTRIKGLNYTLIKTNGSTDEKSVKLFDSQWFKKFLDYTLDAMFYGNSLIEVQKNKSKLEIVLIPRENVIPEFQEIKPNPSQNSGTIDYSAPVYSKSLIDVNNDYDPRNLGELLKVAKLILFKNEVLLNWSQHIEIFGQPIRVATTDSSDPVEINTILTYLKDLGRSGYLVKNSQTEIDFVGADSNSSSSTMYMDFNKTMNDEISKQMLGGTMLTDSGSSRSQSEVHERGSYLYTKADIDFVQDTINNKLIPILQRLGLISSKGIEFKFQEPEILSVQEKLDIDSFLLLNFKVKDINYFEKRYGVELEMLEDDDDEVNTLKQEMTFANNNDRYNIDVKLTE